MATAYEHIKRNKRRSLFFSALFPISFTLFVYLSARIFHFLWSLILYTAHDNVFTYSSLWKRSLTSMHETCLWLLPLCFALAAFWVWQAWRQGDLILLESLPRVRPVMRAEYPEAIQLLENLCIASGDYLPSLYVVEDKAMNSFSLGMNPMKGTIVLSTGLLDNLDRAQLEAVLAHELLHIRYYDTRLMVILFTCLAFFTFAGECLFYGPDTESELGKINWLRIRILFPFLIYIGAALIAYGYIFAPAIRGALSRSREMAADAGAVLLTRYPRGLVRALWKISQDCNLRLFSEHPLLAMMCIAYPEKEKGLFAFLSGINASHPPLEERLHELHDMDSLFIKK